jgi:hypothetical protein
VLCHETSGYYAEFACCTILVKKEEPTTHNQDTSRKASPLQSMAEAARKVTIIDDPRFVAAVPSARLRIIVTVGAPALCAVLVWLTASYGYVIVCSLWWLLLHRPPVEFIADVVVVVGTILAIASPLILTTISDISKDYKSDVVAANFRRQSALEIYLPLIVANLICAVSWKFVGPSIPKFPAVIIAWFVFVTFIVIVCWLFRLLMLLLKHTNADYLLDTLFEDANKVLDD